MRWKVHGERTVYDSEWVRLALVDVEPPGGPRFEHHVVRPRGDAAVAVVVDADRRLLLIWRHRFVTDTWGWELPGGYVEPGEAPADAAAREVLEETGWRPGPVRPLCAFEPLNGLLDLRLWCFWADGAEHVGPPSDRHEAERIEWVAAGDLRAMVRAGEVPDGPTLTAVLWAMALGPPGGSAGGSLGGSLGGSAGGSLGRSAC